MKTVVGIDLGTSNTAIAIAEPDSRVLTDDEGHGLLPSVVAFPPTGEVMVGRAAKERRVIDAKNTIFSAKRLMGKVWGSPDVEEARKRLPFELRQGENRVVRVMARGELYTLPELSAFILRKARMVAEKSLGRRVDAAVITVPANFDERQRAATKLAGELADLEVLGILNEPTAAALAYGLQGGERQRVVVYDFGGGTFDVTLLEIEGETFRVKGTAGDMNLGGDDVDLLIADRIADAYLRRHRYDPRADSDIFAQLRVVAEGLKHDLTGKEEASARLDDLVFGEGGRGLQFGFSLKHSDLDAMIAPLVERSIKVCAEALDGAGWKVGDVDQVLLVGGSTRLRLIRKRVAEFFKREPSTDLNPDEAIALGAALQAQALLDRGVVPKRKLPSMAPPPPPASLPDRPRVQASAVQVRAPDPAPDRKRWVLAAILLVLAAGVALVLAFSRR